MPCCQCDKGDCADKRCTCSKNGTPCVDCKPKTDPDGGRCKNPAGGKSEAIASSLPQVLKEQIQKDREERAAREEQLKTDNQELKRKNQKLKGKNQKLEEKVTVLENEVSELKRSYRTSELDSSLADLTLDTPTK